MNCWYCGGALVWQSDHDLEDLYGEGEGIVTILECSSCKAFVEYTKEFKGEGEDE